MMVRVTESAVEVSAPARVMGFAPVLSVMEIPARTVAETSICSSKVNKSVPASRSRVGRILSTMRVGAVRSGVY